MGKSYVLFALFVLIVPIAIVAFIIYKRRQKSSHLAFYPPVNNLPPTTYPPSFYPSVTAIPLDGKTGVTEPLNGTSYPPTSYPPTSYPPPMSYPPPTSYPQKQ